METFEDKQTGGLSPPLSSQTSKETSHTPVQQEENKPAGNDGENNKDEPVTQVQIGDKSEPENSRPASVSRPEPENSRPASVSRPEPENSRPTSVSKPEPENSRPASVSRHEPENSRPASVSRHEPDDRRAAPESKSPNEMSPDDNIVSQEKIDEKNELTENKSERKNSARSNNSENVSSSEKVLDKSENDEKSQRTKDFENQDERVKFNGDKLSADSTRVGERPGINSGHDDEDKDDDKTDDKAVDKNLVNEIQKDTILQSSEDAEPLTRPISVKENREEGEDRPQSVNVHKTSRPVSRKSDIAENRPQSSTQSQERKITSNDGRGDSVHSSRIGTPQLSSSRVDGVIDADVHPSNNISSHSRPTSRPQSKQKQQQRPTSQQNGFVEQETIEVLDMGAPTTTNRSRPSSGYRKSGVQTPVHLPEIRQTTPLNLVTSDESTSHVNGHVEDSSFSKGQRSHSSRAHSKTHNSNNDMQVVDTSLVYDKNSRPGSRISSQLDLLENSQALVPATASSDYSNKQNNSYSNTSISKYGGLESITPHAGFSSITPRATTLSMKCVVCDNTLRDPRILPCLHSLCFGCLDALMESNKTKEEFACPACDEKISILNPEFVNNVYLLGILGTEAAKSGEAGQCVVCNLKNIPKQAEYQCLDCVDLLCENCGFAHSATRATINHLVVSLKDLATGEYDAEIRQRSKVKCRNHPDQPFDNFCQVCDILICRECRLLDHMGHKYVPIEEAHKKTERKLMDLIQRTITKQHGISAKHKRLSRTMSEIDSMEENLMKYIEKKTREIIEKLERDKDETIVKLKNHMDKQRIECMEQKNESDAEYKKITTGIEVSEEIVQNGRHDEMLYLAPVLQKRLMALSQTELPTKEETQVDFPSIHLHDDFKHIEDLRVFYMAPEDENAPSKLALLPGKPSMSLKLLERIKILGPRDYMTSKITGLACTSDGNIVVGDSGNANVKLFSSKGQYIDTLLSCKPVALAACGNVVAVSDRFSIQLISTDKKFRRRISFNSNGSIFAVTSYRGRHFAVLVPIENSFKILNTKGEVVEEFPMVRPRRRGMQRNPVFLTSNNQGDLIFSDWGSNSIVHINNTGEVLHEYRCGNIGRYNNGWMPGGMAVDNYDNIVIADQQNDEVFILNKDLRIIFKRKTKKDGMDKPLLIAGDSQGHYFVAGKRDSVNVYITKYS